MIRIAYDKYNTFEDDYAHIYYKKPYSYYKLRFDYRFIGEQVPGGERWNVRNSGIMLHSQSAESNDYGQYFPVSIEIQLLGGLGAGERPTGNVCTPGTALVMDGKVDYRHCISSQSKTYHGDRWVSAEVVVLGGESITHLIESDTVLKYQSPQIGGGFTNPKMGIKIGLHVEWIKVKTNGLPKRGNPLHKAIFLFRPKATPSILKNIRLLNLCGCKDPKAKNFKSYFIKANNSLCIY